MSIISSNRHVSRHAHDALDAALWKARHEPSRNELRAMLADAVRNTAALQDNLTGEGRESTRSLSQNTEPAAHEFRAAIASAADPGPQSMAADAPLPKKRKRYGAEDYPL